MRTLARAVYAYLTDWRNLAVHAVIGVALLLVIFVAPLPAYVRVLVLLAVVAFNVLRMRRDRSRPLQDL